MQYKKINNLLGWLCLIIASSTYILTLEPSVSFWDCGEFISCAYRLQIAHQPGYPVFAMLGKMFSLLSLGDSTKVAYFMNMGSAIASGVTIMFLFWTITALAKKMLLSKPDDPVHTSNLIVIMGAGLVGALAFTYTDTFWFSAVETIVFALSSMCTAIVFWAILKWDAQADEPRSDRWLIFIAYIMGLSIGIHLLNLLTIPAIAMVYFFRRSKKITVKNGIRAFLTGVAILGFVQYGIRGYTVKLAAYFDLFFVNSLGLGFGTGAFFFISLLIAAIVWGILYSIRNKKPKLNLALLCIAFIYFGYGSFAYIPIRAAADPHLNNSHPDNAFTLYGYLNRVQYGENPLLSGPYFDSKIIEQKEGEVIYRKGKTQYENAGRKIDPVYDRTTFLPRMYSTSPQDVQFYKSWLQMPEDKSPTFIDNLQWMLSWQMSQMYWRYFLWNFVGRYNDSDGQTDPAGIDGNWTSGLFDNSKNLPKSVIGGITYTPLYAAPLILGLIGVFYHVKRKKKDALVIFLLFLFTGLAIVLYVNQPSIQPRERDYSYVGSFYAFAIWIGLGVLAIAELIRKAIHAKAAAIASTVIGLLMAPVLLAAKEWKSHDRSTKWVARDMAFDYLISCPANAILFTYGDNDTYPLWYAQEVEGIRPDVRIVNLSLLGTEWYIRQMQKRMNQSAPLPITMPYDKYKEGIRDAIPYNDQKIAGSVELKEVFDFITSDQKQIMLEYQNGEYTNYLPTKNFKITINPDEVIKNGVIAPDRKNQLAKIMEWQFSPNYITKDNLAMLDILAHNDWKRPICFTITMNNENFIGLQPYLYKEGFIYHLIPLEKDNKIQNQLSKTNPMIMYDNIMNKFEFGNFKNARYLDQQSRSAYYPVMTSTFIDLIQGLIQEGHHDLALKALHKYDQEMPEVIFYFDFAGQKLFLAELAFQLNDIPLGNKLLNTVNESVKDQLDYNYHLYTQNKSKVDTREIQLGLQLLNAMVDLTKKDKQNLLSGKLQTELNDYMKKFGN
jgi:hypothetical protein